MAHALAGVPAALYSVAVRVWTAFIGGAALAAAAFGAYPEVCAWRDRDLGILVGEQVPPERGALDAWLGRRSLAVNARRVTLLSDEAAVTLSFDDNTSSAFSSRDAGLPGAALYGGSWSAWCADPSRPVERSDG